MKKSIFKSNFNKNQIIWFSNRLKLLKLFPMQSNVCIKLWLSIWTVGLKIFIHI